MTATLQPLAAAWQAIFTAEADDAARATGLVRRHRKLSGATFVQALVFGWLAHPNASLADLAETAAGIDIAVTPQALHQRIGLPAVHCLQAVLRCALLRCLPCRCRAEGLLRRFHSVMLFDATTIDLPACLAGWLPGCGGRGTQAGRAAIKLVSYLDVTTGRLDWISAHPGRTPELRTEAAVMPFAAGTLLLFDLGFFSLDVLAHQDSQGVYWLSRLMSNTAVFDARGRQWRLLGYLRRRPRRRRVDAVVGLGARHRLPCRLLARRVPPDVAQRRRERVRREARDKGYEASAERLALCDWDVLVTNAPGWRLSLEEAVLLRRLRWQVELLFKVWKSEGKIDELRGRKPWRLLCELYAKLLAMVVQHAAVLQAGPPLQVSEQKAARRVRAVAAPLLAALGDVAELARQLEGLAARLWKYCRVQKRQGKLAAFQLMRQADPAGLPQPDPPLP